MNLESAFTLHKYAFVEITKLFKFFSTRLRINILESVELEFIVNFKVNRFYANEWEANIET